MRPKVAMSSAQTAKQRSSQLARSHRAIRKLQQVIVYLEPQFIVRVLLKLKFHLFCSVLKGQQIVLLS